MSYMKEHEIGCLMTVPPLLVSSLKDSIKILRNLILKLIRLSIMKPQNIMGKTFYQVNFLYNLRKDVDFCFQNKKCFLCCHDHTFLQKEHEIETI